MKSKSMMLWLVALTCGLVAMLGVRQVMDREPAEAAQTIAYGPVLVAIEDIGPGTMLSETNSAFKELPLEAIPIGAVTKSEEFQERAILTRAVPGEPIMLAKLGARGVSGAATEIPNGMRVVTVKVNQTTSHSGLMLPGDRVDVLVTFQSRETSGGRSEMRRKTMTVLEFIKVFATDSMRDRAADSSEVQAKNVSLLVTPEQVNYLKLAESKGDLTLALRSPTDDTEAHVAMIDESIFDDGKSSFGVADENPTDYQNNLEGVQIDEDNNDTNDIRKFLANEAKPENPPADTVALEPEPERPKWQMTIFSGQESEQVDFEYTEDGKAIRVEDSGSKYQRASINSNAAQQTSLPDPDNNGFQF
ncbi:hypothetical protein Pla110_39980 [Polystyrenella longa]|uniref:SAF domain-containing protein n=1 Tax=Polystyrenella longa TaxID=2528007 RepID=A0A518CSP0_9PLAN|nr:Flp pilus assembly protein CpaB [Polystyrenella longa]QDU82243.1 hypothetical protein Pla110_39980 [Polystyrenella longa]